MISSADRGKTASMSHKKLRALATSLILGVGLGLPPGHAEEEPFTLFPFITESRDPADGSDHRQVMGVYHRWLKPLPDGSVKKSVYGFPTFYHRSQDDEFFSTFFPLYWSKGTANNYYTLGLPLFYHEYENFDAEGPGEGVTAILPFYFHSWSPTDTDLFFVPFYGYRSFPGEEQHSFLGPLYIYQAFKDRAGEKSGSAHSLLWPLTTIERREDDYTYRVLPLFSVAKHGDSESLLATPFYYEQTNPSGSFESIFPVFARAKNLGDTTDYWGLGLYTRGRTRDESGTVYAARDDALWGAVSFQNDARTGSSHRHILPLSYWESEGHDASTKLYGPFYYGHKSTDESDNRWSLDLFLGNLYVSSVVEGPPQPVPASATVDSSDADSEGSTSTETEALPRPVGDQRSGEAGSDAEGELYPLRVERSVDRGIVWPLLRWYHDDLGREGTWVAPFYFDTRSESSQKLAIFPLSYAQEDIATYELNYFRYFFLLNRERWSTGDRLTLGQIFFDWKSEASRDLDEMSILYPLVEFYNSDTGYGYEILSLVGGNDNVEGGERNADFRFFPFFWYGFSDREVPGSEWQRQHGHFYLLPFYGYEASTTREDHYLLYPLLHYMKATDSRGGEIWPFVFWDDQPTLKALRLFPLHSSEAGEQAGDRWWVDWLFLSKYSYKPNHFSYSLDPYLYSYDANEKDGTSSISLLFGLYQQETAGEDRRHTFFWFLTF